MSAAKDVKEDRRYTKEHEWALAKDGAIVVGITAFAVDQLGDITLVNIDVSEGDSVDANKAFGTIESVKTLSDLFAPLSGKVKSINAQLEDEPELVNDDCWDKGWMIAITPNDPDDLEKLLSAGDYLKHLEESDH